MLTQSYSFRFVAIILLLVNGIISNAQNITISAPKDITVECNAIPKPQNPSATTNCENPNIVFTLSEEKASLNCPDSYIITRKWVAKNACNKTVTVSQKITVRDTKAPTIGSIPTNVTVDCNKIPVPAKVSATDNCDVSVDIAVKDNISAGLCPDSYLIARTWTATDNCGNKSTKTQLISVRDLIRPVLAAIPASVTVDCGAIPLKANPTATDNCDKDVSIVYKELKINGLCENSFILKREWTATDNCGNTAKNTQYLIVQDKKIPTFSSVPTNLTVDCANIQGVTPVASDNCDVSLDILYKETTSTTTSISTGGCSYKIVKEWTATDNCGNKNSTSQTLIIQDTKAPKFTSSLLDMTVSCSAIPSTTINPSAIDNCDKQLIYKVKETKIEGNCVDNYTLKREWTVTDKCGNSATTSQLIKVEDKLAPVIVGTPPNLTMSCSQLIPAISTNITAMDNCDKLVELSFKETKINGSCPDSYTLKREWIATDNCNNKATKTQSIVLRDLHAPVFLSVPISITVDCDKVPASTIKALDNCDKDVSIVLVETKEKGNCPDSYLLKRVWTATDNCGNSKTTSHLITVRDRTIPKFTNTPANITVECNAVPNPVVLTATDNCDKDVLVEFSTSKVNGSCPQNYQIKNTWSATDNCNNNTKYTQTIQVMDRQSPTLDVSISIPVDLTADCKTIPPPAKLKFVDNCDTDIMVTYTEEIMSAQGSCSKKLLRTWIAKDDCNNTKTISHSIYLIDNQVPVITNIPANITVNCENIPQAGTVTVTDNCATNIVATVKDYEEILNCKKTITRLWTATDDCGNTAFASQSISVIDNTPPYVVNPPNLTINLACGATVPVPSTVMFKDKCNDNVSVSYTEEITNGTTPNCPIAKIIRRWTATDPCGNANVFEQTLIFGNSNGGTKVIAQSPIQIIDKAMESPKAMSFQAFPNPTSGLFTLNLASKADEVQITDELGRMILTQNNITDTTIQFDLSREISGVYIIKVRTGENVEAQKIVLVKQ